MTARPPPRLFSEVLAGVRRLDYPPMTEGSDQIDYDASSMFRHIDPIWEICRSQPPKTSWPMQPLDAGLARALGCLVDVEDLGTQRVRLSQMSGLSAANDRDWGTLQAFGDQLTFRRQWPPAVCWYGFETEEDWNETWTQGVLREHSSGLVVVHRAWDDRWFLCNETAAHRLAAAARQDREQRRGTVFEANVRRERIDPDAAATVLRLAVVLLLDETARSAILDLLSETDYRPFFPTDRTDRTLWLPRADGRTRELVNAITTAAPPTHVLDATERLRRVMPA